MLSEVLASVRATKLVGAGVSWVKLLRATGVLMDDSLAAVASTGAVLLALNAELGLAGTARAACKGRAGVLSWMMRAGVALTAGTALITTGVLDASATVGLFSDLLAAIKSTPL